MYVRLKPLHKPKLLLVKCECESLSSDRTIYSMAPSKKAKAQPKKTEPTGASSSDQDPSADLNKDLSRMRALMKYRASDQYKAVALGFFSFIRIDQQMSHPCRAVTVVFRRLTVSCGRGVQEAHRLLWLWCSGGPPSPVVVVFRRPTVSCGCGVQEAHRLLWLWWRRENLASPSLLHANPWLLSASPWLLRASPAPDV